MNTINHKKFFLMRKSFLFLILLSTIMCGMTTYSKSKHVPQMTMTTTASKVRLSLMGVGEATIDWGDGTPSDKITLVNNSDSPVTLYTHSYLGSSTHTIKISGENVKRLYCTHSQLNSLDASKNPNLETLDCENNQLTSLDVSKNPELRWLLCNDNQLTTLDVSKHPELWRLECNNNQLTSLDVSKNPELSTLRCNNNQLTSLDVSNNPELWTLECNNNQLTSLDVSKNPELSTLECNNNQLSSDALNILFGTLPIKGGTIHIDDDPGTKDCNRSIAEEKGWKVEWSGPQMTMTTIASKVGRLMLSGKGVITIDWGDGTPIDKRTLGGFDYISTFYHSYSGSSAHIIKIAGANITALDCSNNQITSLNVSENNMLKKLSCSKNELTSLEISENPILESLYCSDNKLTSLNVSENNMLKTLSCSENELKSLDVSKNPELESLHCSKNKLTILDVSKNPNLKRLECNNNQLTSKALNTLFDTLPTNGGLFRSTVRIDNNPGTSSGYQRTGKKKGWDVEWR